MNQAIKHLPNRDFEVSREKPEQYSFWKNNKNGKTYIVGSIGEMKIGEGEWIESINYRCVETQKLYVRDLGTFLKKFTRVSQTFHVDRGVTWCVVCQSAFANPEQAKNHECITEEEASEICKEHMTKTVSKILGISEETALEILTSKGGQNGQEDS